jgi:hypothetical protein
MMRAAAEPTALSPQAESFYGEALRELSHLGLPFLLAGTYAVSAYTGITRTTKDLDVFCRPGITRGSSRISKTSIIRSRSRTIVGSARSTRTNCSST